MTSQTEPTLLSLSLLFSKTASSHDYTSLPALVSSEFTHRIHPSSLQGFGAPGGRTLDEFVQYLTNLENLIPHLKLDLEHPVSVVVSEKERTVVLHLTSDGTTASGAQFKNEYLTTYRFNEENKIISIDEWLDSALVQEGMAREMEAIKGGSAEEKK